ncbi:hypothetical protein ACS0TY_020413 [Phlomoides rotata]
MRMNLLLEIVEEHFETFLVLDFVKDLEGCIALEVGEVLVVELASLDCTIHLDHCTFPCNSHLPLVEGVDSHLSFDSHSQVVEEFLLLVGKYPRLWALKGAHPVTVNRWYKFGSLASIITIAPSFREISELPNWVCNAVQESWHNNPHLKRGDELEIKFITIASEDMTNSIRYPSFHFMKLQRPDHRSANYIKHQETKSELVINLTEDKVTTRRA